MSTRTTSTSESSTRTKAAEELATTTDADVVGRPVNAELSSPIKPGKRQGSPISASLPSFVARNITFRLLVRMSQYLNCNELPSDCCHDAIIPKKLRGSVQFKWLDVLSRLKFPQLVAYLALLMTNLSTLHTVSHLFRIYFRIHVKGT